MRKTTVEQELSENGRCLIQTVGVSMEPILHNRYSSVVLEKPDSPLSVNDVVLFKRPDGAYVLHRIIRIDKDSFYIRGDNCYGTEIVKREQILGRMSGYFNGDEFTDCAADEKYKKYVKTLTARYIYRQCRAIPGRAVRKLKRSLK